MFLTTFFDKYFANSIKNEKKAKFIQLKWGSMIIGQSIAKLDELSKFFSYLKNNHDDNWKATKFEWGLRPMIRKKVSTLEIKDFATLMNKCRIVEKSYLEMKFERARHNFLRRNIAAEMQKKNNFKNKVNPRKGKQMLTREALLLCNKCGKSRGSKPCLFSQNVCYRCGKLGHYAKDCNMGKPLNNLVPRPQTK